MKLVRLTAPITEYLKKDKVKTKFVWHNEAQEALGAIKSRLTSAPVLANPDYDKPFTIQADASGVGMGAILVQGKKDEERVIAYFSAIIKLPNESALL